MSHSYRKTRTKDKRERARRGGRPPQVSGGKIVTAPPVYYLARDGLHTYPCGCRGAGCSACTDDDGLPL